MRLGVDSYSLRWQGWDALQLMEYAAQQGLDNVHFSERGNLASLDPDYLRLLVRRAEALSLQLELGMGSFDRFSRSFRAADGTGEEQLTAMLQAASAVGSPVVRCFLGTQEDRLGPVPVAQHIAECVRVLRAVGPLARRLGLKVAVENHGGVDLLARELRALVEEAGPDTVGVCLDTGNPAWAGEDPVLSAEVLAPYVVTSHVRDSRVWASERGAQAQWVPLGQGNVDLRRILDILAEQAPAAPVDLEIITALEPREIPYYDPASDYWRMYPGMLAQDLVRFIALAQKGQPAPLPQLLASSAQEGLAESLRAQQREHFEASVRYAREELGLGEGGRGQNA
jgi:3-oxoisoapionate decarboxylase